MREFAQSLAAELKRRAELLGRQHFAEWHTQREVSGRMVSQRPAPPRPSDQGAGDLEAPPSSTMRLRPAAARKEADPAPREGVGERADRSRPAGQRAGAGRSFRRGTGGAVPSVTARPVGRPENSQLPMFKADITTPSRSWS
jgi:hypothetical protein